MPDTSIRSKFLALTVTAAVAAGAFGGTGTAFASVPADPAPHSQPGDEGINAPGTDTDPADPTDQATLEAAINDLAEAKLAAEAALAEARGRIYLWDYERRLNRIALAGAEATKSADIAGLTRSATQLRELSAEVRKTVLGQAQGTFKLVVKIANAAIAKAKGKVDTTSTTAALDAAIRSADTVDIDAIEVQVGVVTGLTAALNAKVIAQTAHAKFAAAVKNATAALNSAKNKFDVTAYQAKLDAATKAAAGSTNVIVIAFQQGIVDAITVTVKAQVKVWSSKDSYRDVLTKAKKAIEAAKKFKSPVADLQKKLDAAAKAYAAAKSNPAAIDAQVRAVAALAAAANQRSALSQLVAAYDASVKVAEKAIKSATGKANVAKQVNAVKAAKKFVSQHKTNPTVIKAQTAAVKAATAQVNSAAKAYNAKKAAKAKKRG